MYRKYLLKISQKIC